jgi:hypothetical protein
MIRFVLWQRVIAVVSYVKPLIAQPWSQNFQSIAGATR